MSPLGEFTLWELYGGNLVIKVTAEFHSRGINQHSAVIIFAFRVRYTEREKYQRNEQIFLQG